MEQDHAAARDKRRVALTSVLAAVFLTVFKLIIGLLTNSLGILAEAAHSGLDLVAALVTYLAVRFSDRPPDQEHHFGHGKVENLSALFETLLLLVTCVWIIYEAVDRLLFKDAEVEVNLWAFAIMVVSIIVDINRSRMLYRAAEEHRSQALEADALHFSTDIWSSAVVIVGLGLIALADWLPQYRAWLLRADAVAALVVAGIVIWVSLQLGKRTVDALLDRAPAGLEEQVRAAIAQVEGVQTCSRLRLRAGGPTIFVEATVQVSPDLPAAQAHEVATQVEQAVLAAHPHSDVMVHVEPTEFAAEDIVGQARGLSAQAGLSVHDVHAHRLSDGYHVDLDLEVPPGLSLEEAHQVATDLENTLRDRIKYLARVSTHIEVAPPPLRDAGQDVTASHPDLVTQVQTIAESQDPVLECHDVSVRQVEDGSLYVSLHCLCPGGIDMQAAHRCSAQVEDGLRTVLPQVAHFLIHVEPAKDDS
ncbi:MAG: cation-efflux pump [Chloroflexi bacterium]|nr:cation-efflux pump [Chloroflexota bacterium]MBU1749172.1 cation-efflux pump [Chloroflexota bacterium]